jgi:hypothetical protein
MTAQFPDRIVFNGEELKLLGEPFTEWLETKFKGPFWRGMFGYNIFASDNTACRRGYTATWKIEGDSLFLIEIRGELAATGKQATLRYFFPTVDGEVFAEWFSGTIRLAGGDCVEYEHGGWRSRYEREIYLLVENGVVKQCSEERALR